MWQIKPRPPNQTTIHLDGGHKSNAHSCSQTTADNLVCPHSSRPHPSVTWGGLQKVSEVSLKEITNETLDRSSDYVSY